MNFVPCSEKYNEASLLLPLIREISGVRNVLTSEETTELNAAPMTTPTAKSTTLPRKINFLNPFMNSMIVIIHHFPKRYYLTIAKVMICYDYILSGCLCKSKSVVYSTSFIKRNMSLWNSGSDRPFNK